MAFLETTLDNATIQKIIEDCLKGGSVGRTGLYNKTDKDYDKHSGGYDQLAWLCKYFAKALLDTTGGIALEIGSHTGTGLMLFFNTMKYLKKKIPLHSVDPYLVQGPGHLGNTFFYILKNVVPIIEELEFSPQDLWTHFSVTDTVYMENIYPTLPVNYQKYSFAFLDGPHDYVSVKAEFDWIQDKVVPNGVVVIDDFGIDSDVYEYIIEKYKEFIPSSFPNAIVFIRKG